MNDLPVKLIVAAFLAGLLSASGNAAGSGSRSFIQVDGMRFVDGQDRQVLFHGMSVISKNPKENYQSWHGPEDFARMRSWGMNCVRLGILWDGLEPAPGEYDEDYLKQVDQRIAWAKSAGLYVFLDMHQDLFSVRYSDGAPEWATLTDGLAHIEGKALWSDAYITSPAIRRAFDNFYANKPGPDGVGVQDRFALAWKHVAKRYAGEPMILGYDLFNEPNIGSGNLPAQAAMVIGFCEAIAEKTGEAIPDPAEVAAQWLDPEGRGELVAKLQDMNVYRAVIDAAEAIYQKFERDSLVPLYQRVANAIREVDTRHILFLETSMASNRGVRTGLEAILGPGGNHDPQQAYAPHGYDIVVDTPDLVHANSERVTLIFSRHAEAAARLGMPVMVGEWGAYGRAGEAILPAARHMLRQLEQHGFSETYWLYERNIEDRAYFEILHRPCAQRIAGKFLSCETDPEARIFQCVWEEPDGATAPSRIYVPDWMWPGRGGVQLGPEGPGFTIEAPAEDSKNVVLVIPPAGSAGERSLEVAAK